MRKKGRIYQLAIALLLCFLQMAGIAMYGQDRPRAASKRAQRHQTDTLNTVVNRDSLTVADSLAAENKRKMLEMTASPTRYMKCFTSISSLPSVLTKKSLE